MGPLCSKLNKMVAEFTQYRPQHDSRFEVYKSNTSDYCKQSALVSFAQLLNIPVYIIFFSETRGRPVDEYHGPYYGC